MKQCWSERDLAEFWTLSGDEKQLSEQRTQQGRMGLAVLLKFFQLEVRFPYARTGRHLGGVHSAAERWCCGRRNGGRDQGNSFGGVRVSRPAGWGERWNDKLPSQVRNFVTEGNDMAKVNEERVRKRFEDAKAAWEKLQREKHAKQRREKGVDCGWGPNDTLRSSQRLFCQRAG